MSERLFCDNWQFMLTEVGSELSDALAAKDWHDVEIPHDWLIGDAEELYRSGDGWYRKFFEMGELDEDDVFILCFDGIYMDSTVYINGKAAGGRRYGYSCFSIDITKYLVPGENELYVRARYQAPNSRWYSGAGIYRNVWLRRTRRTYIKENGVYIATRNSGDSFIVIIETNSAGDDCGVRHTVYDAKGRKLARVTAAQSGGFSRAAFCASKPRLWDVDDPVCYTMISELVENGQVISSVSNTFGFRTAEFDPDEGFRLNGRRLKLKGVCMHHDLGCLGAAVNKYAIRRQLKILRSFGVNAVRCSHNMPARELIDLCCEMGILVVSECFDMWEEPKTEFDYARFFDEHYEEDVMSWITRDRNAPCVIMWSIGNEIYDTHKSARGLEVAKMLMKAVRRYDMYENAAITIASNYMRWENAQKVADHIKLVGYNYSEDLYDGHHEAYPDWFIYGSETASTVRSRGIYHAPADMPLLTHTDGQCSDYGNSVVGWGKQSEKAIIEDRDRPYCGGQFVWTGFDYIGEPTPYTSKNSYFGIVDTAGFPKASYYLYMAAWAGERAEPFVHLIPCWDGNIGEEITVMAYSNLPEVELFYNGRSAGRRRIDMKNGDTLHAEWRLRYRKGTVEARAYDSDGNLIATDTVSSFGDPESLDAVPDKYIMNADGRDLIFIEISAVDSAGNFAANARNRVKVSVEGCGRLVGLDNGDSNDYDSYRSDNRRLFSGKLLAVVQSTLEPGGITVRIKSDGMWGKELNLTSLECDVPEGISVVDEYYPAVKREYRAEIPIRKIELTATRNVLDEQNPQAGITVKLWPANASYADVDFICVNKNGTPCDLSTAEKNEHGCLVTGRADGSYIVRAYTCNGGTAPQVCSDLVFTNKGLGSLTTDPYAFVPASSAGFCDKPMNIIGGGAVSTAAERTSFCFDNVNFGKTSSDRLELYCGNGDHSGPVRIDLWVEYPQDKGRNICSFDFEYNGLWDSCAPQTFTIPERLRGNCSLAFAVSRHVIFGGFRFLPSDRAFSRLRPTENDEIYGDDYKISGSSITDIGNNVVINFDGLDFGSGASGISINGRTPNDLTSIQLRTVGEDGVQRTQLLEFAKSQDYTVQFFTLDDLKGKQDVSFVFMPGSRFDFDWFMFSE